MIAISATFTADPLTEVLGFWDRELGLEPVELAPYHQVFQQLLDPASLLRTNQHGANVVLARFEDWARYQESGDARESDAALRQRLGEPASLAKIERCATDFMVALEEAARSTQAPLLVFVCPCSPAAAVVAPFHALATELEERLGAASSRVPNLYLTPAAELMDLYPVESLHDPYADEIGHIPYSPTGFAALGTLIARKIHALSSPPAKVIVLDCDQTLWRGVCGEDGPGGVVLDEPRRRLQELALAQRQAGVLLCLGSKNQEEDVWNTFAARPDFPLERRHLTSWRINWSPKSENLRSLAAELGLGLDSFVLIDDNPVECAEVRAGCPQVMVLELPADEQEIPRVLRHFWAFDRLRTTVEDRERAELYGQQMERERHRRCAASFEDFLAGLELVIEVLPIPPASLGRVAQLTQRTNQFNASTLRRSEGEIQRLLADGVLEGRMVAVHDRLGDYGVVGVVLFAARPPALDIDTFLLSCRVLGRGVEHRVLSVLAHEAADRGLRHIDVRAIPTSKNRPVLDFLRSVPGACEQPHGEGGLVFRLPALPVAMTYTPTAPDSSVLTLEAGGAVAVASPERNGFDRASLLLRIATELSDAREIRRRIKESRDRPSGDRTGDYIPPLRETEVELARIFAEVLGFERMGARDNFFDLGIHSLQATQVLSRIRDAFGVELPLRIFFEAPTLSGLAAEVERGRDSSRERPTIASCCRQRTSPPPLSLAQERFWAGRCVEAGSVPSVVPVLLVFEGPLDLVCLRRALQELVDRHEVLRTSFREEAEAAIQVVHAVFPVALPVVDLEEVPPGGRMAEIRFWSDFDGRTQFDYEHGPLFRLAFFRCSEGENALFLNFHHVAFDGWSYPLLLGELSALYNAFLAGRASPLPPLTVQYQDFARWQRQCLSEEALAKQVAFWREHLEGALSLDLRGGRSRPLHPSYKSGMEWITVPKELERKLEAFSAEHRVTLFMALLTAFNVLLYHETGKQDIVIICLFANRNQVEIENLIGNFYAGLPLRTRLAGACSFRELLVRVRDVTLAAHEHPDILYERVFEGMSFQDKEDRGGLATFRVLFQLAKMPPSDPAWSGLEVTRLPVNTGIMRKDLSLFLTQSNELGGRFRYNRDVLEPERVARMRDHFLQILATVVADPDRPLTEL